jgi:NTP pyrophosphatase (non-canonical NTP hydrolase)
MDVNVKRRALKGLCENNVGCEGCPLYTPLYECDIDGAPDEMIETWFAKAFPNPVIKDSYERSMSHDEKMKYIRSKLDENELLCQLAEEAAELSKAASKLARIIRRKNPTPVTRREALDNVIEELADVRTCMVVLGYDREDFLIGLQMHSKIERWVERLQKMGGAV